LCIRIEKKKEEKGPGSSVTSRKEKPMIYKHISFHRLRQTHGVQLFILPALLNMIKPIGQGAVRRDMTSLQILFLHGELQESYKIYLYRAWKEKGIAIPIDSDLSYYQADRVCPKADRVLYKITLYQTLGRSRCSCYSTNMMAKNQASAYDS